MDHCVLLFGRFYGAFKVGMDSKSGNLWLALKSCQYHLIGDLTRQLGYYEGNLGYTDIESWVLARFCYH